MIIYGGYYSQHIFIVCIALFFLVLGFFKYKYQLIRDLFRVLAIFNIAIYISLTFITKENFKTFKKNYFKNLQIEKKLSDDELIKEYENTNIKELFEKYKKFKKLKEIKG